MLITNQLLRKLGEGMSHNPVSNREFGVSPGFNQVHALFELRDDFLLRLILPRVQQWQEVL